MEWNIEQVFRSFLLIAVKPTQQTHTHPHICSSTHTHSHIYM